jgi:nucleoside-diphosphate-sugar epimerase
LACPAEGLDVIIVNPGVIIGPGFPIKEVANLLKKSGGLSYYTLGTTGFISVTDVVSISYELMNSTIKK